MDVPDDFEKAALNKSQNKMITSSGPYTHKLKSTSHNIYVCELIYLNVILKNIPQFKQQTNTSYHNADVTWSFLAAGASASSGSWRRKNCQLPSLYQICREKLVHCTSIDITIQTRLGHCWCNYSKIAPETTNTWQKSQRLGSQNLFIGHSFHSWVLTHPRVSEP